MKEVRQVLLGVIAALFSSAIILGGISLSLVENGVQLAQAPAALSPTPSAPAPTALPGEPTFTQPPTVLPTITPVPTATSSCQFPPGWVQITIQPDDTLNSLAQKYGITPEELQAGNCLVATTLLAGSYLYVPGALPTPTATLTFTPLPPSPTPEPTQAPKPTQPCGRPAGWVAYRVRPGDTLSALSRTFGVTIRQLQNANCMGNSIDLRAGQTLYVPFQPPTRTPTPMPTPRPTATTVSPPTERPLPTATTRPTDPPPPTPTPVTPTDMPPTPVPPTNTQPPADTPTSPPPPPPPATRPPPTSTSPPLPTDISSATETPSATEASSATEAPSAQNVQRIH